MEPTIFGVPRPTGRFLKNGASASATSSGSWKRRSGSFAIILATRADNSAGISERTRLNGVASIVW